MSSFEPIVLLLQASDLQRQVWQAVLRSQALRTAIASDHSLENLQHQLSVDPSQRPSLVLFDCTLPGAVPEAIVAACNGAQPSVCAIALVPSDREAAELRYWSDRVRVAGAADAIPACSREDVINTAIAGIRRVLAALGGRPLDSEALVASLLALKRDLKLSSAGGPDVDQSVKTLDSLTTVEPEPPGDHEPTYANDDAQPKRRYRGQIY